MSENTMGQDRPKPRMKRFYTDVSIAKEDSTHVLLLDGRQVKTPLRRALAIPSSKLAGMVAEEWRAQGEYIEPETMVLTGFCNAAIDYITENRGTIRANIVAFADTDTLSYREDPETILFAEQERLWEPMLRTLEQAHGMAWMRTSGVMPMPQTPEVLELAHRVTADDDAFELTAFSQIVELIGSFALGLAYREGRYSADAIWDAAFLEQTWQAEQWGQDADAAAQLKARRVRYDAATAMWQALISPFP